MKKHIWVIELQWSPKDRWETTVGVKLSRDEAREELKNWKSKVVGAKFRLVKYIAWRND